VTGSAPPVDAVPAVEAVLFDLHSTLLDQGDAAGWLAAAVRRAGADPAGRDANDERLLALLDRIWERARVIDPAGRRDLDPASHRAVFDAVLADLPDVEPALAAALYGTLFDGWRPYADTVPVLSALRSAGKRTVLVSNVGVDVRPVLDRVGLLPLLDAVVLSVDLGVAKPAPQIFARALEVAGVPAERALMVGDSPGDDSGGAALGIRTLLLPRTRGPVHGLAAVVRLVR
jgi:HAD superfamily hydrolase (TIGR01509 family)